MIEIVFGERYRDDWSGLVGVATARTEYAFSGPSVCLEWRTNDGYIKETWVKQERLVHVDLTTTGEYV